MQILRLSTDSSKMWRMGAWWHPGARTISSQILNGDHSQAFKIVATQPWASTLKGRGGGTHHTGKISCICIKWPLIQTAAPHLLLLLWWTSHSSNTTAHHKLELISNNKFPREASQTPALILSCSALSTVSLQNPTVLISGGELLIYLFLGVLNSLSGLIVLF